MSEYKYIPYEQVVAAISHDQETIFRLSLERATLKQQLQIAVAALNEVAALADVEADERGHIIEDALVAIAKVQP